MQGQRWRSVAVVSLLLLAPFVAASVPASAATSPYEIQGVLDHCDDDTTSKPMRFEAAGNRTECWLAFDNHAIVDDAYVDLTVQGLRSNARDNPFDRTPDVFPVDPYLDVSTDGDLEWSFESSRFGPLGHTTVFSDGSTSAQAELERGQGFELSFDVPSHAEIVNATITLSGDPRPYWAAQYQLTDANWSDGEDGPALASYAGLLWAAWSTADSTMLTGGMDDFDVVVRSYDGVSWGPVRNISPPPTEDFDDDREVIMAVYNGLLWVLWSHGEDHGTEGLTDLVYRTYDGTDWSPTIEKISPENTDGLNSYEQAAVFNNQLWVIWKTTDTSISAGTAGQAKDLDIVVRAFDGPSGTWGPTVELTEPSNNYLDWVSDIAVLNGRLYVVWEASYWVVGQLYTIVDHPLADIHLRTFDGSTWSPIQNMSESMDVTESDPNDDQFPRFGTFDNPVSGLRELYIVWMRGCLQKAVTPQCPTDYEVAFTKFNGAAWSAPAYLTEPDAADDDEDMFPCMADFSDVFYVFWVSGVNITITREDNVDLIAAYGDIVYRAYNGREWSEIKEVTTNQHLDNVSHPSCEVYNERLYVSWESPTNYPDGTREWDITVRNIDFHKVAIEGVYGGLIENYTSPVNLSFYDTPFPFNLTELNSLVGDEPVASDAWGNEISRIRMRLSAQNKSHVEVTGIDIRYAYHIRVNITEAIAKQLAAEHGDFYQTSTVRVPLTVGIGDGAGRITIDQIYVAYRIDYPPVAVQSIASIRIDEDSGTAAPLELNDYFTDDWDAGRLRFEMGNATNTQHVLLSLEGTKLSVGTLTPNWCGVATFEITAYDRNDYFARSNLVTVFVRCVNDPPVLQPVDDISIAPGQVYSGDLSAFDPDIGDLLTFSTDSFWVTVDPDTGAFLIGNKPGMPDMFDFNVTVNDLAGESDSHNVTLTVNRIPTPYGAQPQNVDFPYYLFLLLLAPAAAYTAYRVRARRLQAEEEAREEMQLAQDKADLKEMDEG